MTLRWAWGEAKDQGEAGGAGGGPVVLGAVAHGPGVLYEGPTSARLQGISSGRVKSHSVVRSTVCRGVVVVVLLGVASVLVLVVPAKIIGCPAVFVLLPYAVAVAYASPFASVAERVLGAALVAGAVAVSVAATSSWEACGSAGKPPPSSRRVWASSMMVV